MTDLGQYLRKHRHMSGKSLRAIVAPGFSQQVLSNYELGVSLPQEESLERLAKLYDAPIEDVRARYHSSVAQLANGPIGEEPFLQAVSSAQEGDDFVVVTQQPLVEEAPEVADSIVELLLKGARFTYVAYVPAERPDGKNGGQPYVRQSDQTYGDLWASGHKGSAQLLWRYLRKTPERRKTAHQLRYLLIGEPDKTDFYFLKGEGASLYLCRPEEREEQFLESQSWLEVAHRDGRHFWHPYTQKSQALLHDWLVFNCGLDLPGSEEPHEAIDNDTRHVRLLTIEDYLVSH